MVFISGFGTGCAARTKGWAISLLAPLLLGAAQPASLEVDIAGLRSTRGQVMLCLTQDPKRFPQCAPGAGLRRMMLPAGEARTIRFADLVPGDYAIAVIHDENGNGRLDRAMGIPREGIGFSRNPRITMGPPSFAAARFRIEGGRGAQTVQIKYFL